MTSRLNLRIFARATITMLSLSLSTMCVQADSPSEAEALIVADDLKMMISAGTGVITGLQPLINTGNPDHSSIDGKHLLELFLVNYQQATGSFLDTDTGGLLGESRREFVESYTTVLENHRETLAVGGQDSFVPAYFRSELLAEFNERLGGRIKGYATNRETELLNPDWSIDALMDYSLFAYYIQELLEEQETEPTLQSLAGRVVGYYPMVLKDSCIACHARQGLVQEVGDFGGALVTEVLLKN